MRYWVPVIFIFCCIGQSCKMDHPDKATYIAYSLNGASCNGAFRIEPDKDMNTLDATAVLLPETDDNPEVLILTFYDYTDQREVAFIIPAKEVGSVPYLLLHDSEFGMVIANKMDECILTSGVEHTVSGVSVDISRFDRSTGFLGIGVVDYMEGYFVGIMTFKNEMNEVEQHTVEGDFVFNSDDVF